VKLRCLLVALATLGVACGRAGDRYPDASVVLVSIDTLAQRSNRAG